MVTIGLGARPARRAVTSTTRVRADRRAAGAAEREFDVGLAPLADTAFNRARSNVKLKEYAAAGAMWLASPVGPYVGMGETEGGRWSPTTTGTRRSAPVLDYRARAPG